MCKRSAGRPRRGGTDARGRNQIAAYLNLDMVGSPNAVPSVYSDGDERLARVLRDAIPGRDAGVSVDGRRDR